MGHESIDLCARIVGLDWFIGVSTRGQTVPDSLSVVSFRRIQWKCCFKLYIITDIYACNCFSGQFIKGPKFVGFFLIVAKCMYNQV